MAAAATTPCCTRHICLIEEQACLKDCALPRKGAQACSRAKQLRHMQPSCIQKTTRCSKRRPCWDTALCNTARQHSKTTAGWLVQPYFQANKTASNTIVGTCCSLLLSMNDDQLHNTLISALNNPPRTITNNCHISPDTAEPGGQSASRNKFHINSRQATQATTSLCKLRSATET